MKKARVVIFSSGSGTGPEQLFLYSLLPHAGYKIVGIVVSRENVECIKRAIAFDIPFKVLTSYTEQDYQAIVEYFQADYVFLSGYLKPVRGLDPKTTTNIHPGLLPKFGGKGMYGDYVHAAVLEAFKIGKITHTGFSMHFVPPYVTSDDYDSGPVFYQRFVPCIKGDTVQTLGGRVNKQEHIWQPPISDLVAKKIIRWDGKNHKSLIVPESIKKLDKMYYPTM